MRRVLLATATLAALLVAQSPAGATSGDHPISFSGAVPCGAVCAYWPPGDLAGFEACTNPFPPGSFQDILTESAPSRAGKKTILVLEIFPQVDWDSFICSMGSGGSHNGPLLSKGANELPGDCDNLVGPSNPVSVGCKEVAQAPAVAGQKYVLRAYNWSDALPCPGKYYWVFV